MSSKKCPTCWEMKKPADKEGHCSYVCASGGGRGNSSGRSNSSVKATVMEDGRIQLSGATYAVRDQIKARGGKWDATARVWTLPAGTDTVFAPAPSPAAVAPAPVRTREELTLAEWQMYATSRRNAGRCCSHATSFWEYAQGPTNYRCERHGITRSSYTGD